MLSPSPLDYLAAFALAFIGGALCSTCICRYVGRLWQEVVAHA